MAAIARNHHYVPKFYLSNFGHRTNSIKKPKLTVIDRITRRRFVSQPSQVAVERDFNRIDADGISADAVENAFAAFEGEAKKAIDRIKEKRSLSNDEDRILLLNLVAMLAARNPRFRSIMTDVTRDVAKDMMRILVSNKGIFHSTMKKAVDDGIFEDKDAVSYEELKDFIESERYNVNVPTLTSLHYELHVIEPILQTLVRRKWILLRAKSSETGFITSDHPVCLMWADTRRYHGPFPPGYGLAGTEVLFPLSHDLALLGTFEGQAAEMDVDTRRIAVCNGRIAAFSRRQVYAPPGDFLYAWSHSDRLRPGRELLNDRLFPRERLGVPDAP